MRIRRLSSFAGLLVALSCKAAPKVIVYQSIPVERRSIIVSARATGTVQPDTVVQVKSKASGEILEMKVETGQTVSRGTLLVRVDQRTPRNRLNQATADLDVAKARYANAVAQRGRSDTLFKTQAISTEEHETAVLAVANEKAAVIGAQVALDNAKIAMEDTDVLAPINGTVISKLVERGQVISSPSTDVGGGTVLLSMADLNLVQVSTLVDETDIGKIKPGQRATVTVGSYPNQPFEGEVLKIEPLAQTVQNVTMFAVQVRIENRNGLLKPGMNADVEVHIGQRDSVLAVPNAALRTPKDVGSAAQVLGILPDRLTQMLTDAAKRRDSLRSSMPARQIGGDRAKADTITTVARKPGGNTMTTPDGREVALPDGVTEAQVRALMQKRFGGGQLTDAENATFQKVMTAFRAGGGGGAGRGRRGGTDFQFGGDYIVFVKRNGEAVPVYIRTGLTDLDYSEVVMGLTAADSVLVLPSASLVQQQTDMKQRLTNITGGGGLPGVSSTPATTARPAGGAPAKPPGAR